MLLKNGSLAAGYENSTIIVWKDNSFDKNTKLNGHEERIKCLTLFGNDLLASGSCDSTIKIWKLSTATNIKTLTEHKGCVNAFVSLDFLKKTYLLSASDDSTVKVWNSSFDAVSTLSNHTESVTALAYDPISKYIASGSKNNEINLLTISFKLTVKNELAHKKIIKVICLLKDGLIATASYDSSIKIWKKNESKKLELIATFDHKQSVYSLAVLNNGSLISGSGDSTLKVWNKINETNFECIASLNHTKPVISLAVTSSFIISGLENGSIVVWNEKTFERIQKLNNHTKKVNSIVAINNQSFASASDDGTIKIWKIQASIVLYASLEEQRSAVYCLNVLKDGRIISAGYGPSIFIWEKDTFVFEKAIRAHENSVLGLSVLENGNFISFSADKSIIIWNSNSFTKLESVMTKEEIWSVAVLLNDSFVAGTDKGTLSIFDMKSIDLLLIESLREEKELSQYNAVLALAFIRPDSNSFLLLKGSNDNVIKVLDMKTYKLIASLIGHTSKVTSLISISQKSFASGSNDKSIKIWEYYSDEFLNTFKNSETITENLENIISLAVLNDTKLVSSSIDRYIRVFDKSIEIKQTNEFKSHLKSVQDIVVLDKNMFASCSGDTTIKIWNNSKVIQTLEGHTDYVYALEYAKSETILISGSKDATIRLWNSVTFVLVITLYHHEDSVNSLLVLPNKSLASGSCDKKISIWNLNTFEMIFSLKGHEGCVNALVLYDRNKYLLSGSTDQTIIIWDISNSFKLAEILRGHQGSINSLVIHQEKIASASSDKSIKLWSKYESIEKISGHTGQIWKTCVLNDGLIVTGSYDFTIKVWKKTNQTLELITTIKDHKGVIFGLECLKTQSFFSSSADQTVKFWKKSVDNSFECVKTIDHSNQVTALTVLKSFFITGEFDGRLNIFNQSSFDLIERFIAHDGIVWCLVSLNNQSFASASDDTNIKIWNREQNSSSFECIRNLTEPTSQIYTLALLKEMFLISGLADGSIKVWHLSNFSLIQTLTEHSLKILGLAVFENGYFVSVSADKKTIIWNYNFNSHNFIKNATLVDKSEVWSVSEFSNNSFVTGNIKGDIKVWLFFEEYKPIQTLNTRKEVLDLKVLNNAFLVSASEDGKITVWDNNFQSKEIQAHSRAVLTLNIFDASGTLISSSEDKTIKTWNTRQYILEKTIH